jgi:hypothetical protein
MYGTRVRTEVIFILVNCNFQWSFSMLFLRVKVKYGFHGLHGLRSRIRILPCFHFDHQPSQISILPWVKHGFGQIFQIRILPTFVLSGNLVFKQSYRAELFKK